MSSTPVHIPHSFSDASGNGWSAELNCLFEPGPERTIVRRTHKGPLYMQRPFYPEGAIAHVYLLHPPGGVVAGDVLKIDVTSINGGKGLVSTPGAAKFYRSDGLTATVEQRLKTQGGSLEWLPCENIFFANSKANLNTEIRIEGKDSLAWWEINCFGTQSCDELSKQTAVSSIVDLYVENRLMLRERFLFDEHHFLNMSCGMRKKRVAGTMILTPMHEHSIDYVRNKLANRIGFSATCFDSMLIVRYLGDSAEDAKLGFTSVWSGLRTALNSASPMYPRIWAT